MNDSVPYPHIVKTPDTCHDRPRIEGHRIRVQDVAIWVERLGMTPDEVASGYDLTLGEVHSALAYYFDHIEEIKADLREEEAFVAELKAGHTSPLAERLAKLRRA